ncbi:MAG: hypothetical protein JNJ71_07890 [Rubrivivax sp.]|nr:hypothetical protein [Rubrivivax sp.]
MAPRFLSATSIALAACLGTAPAWAIGFGSLRASAIMGQPLDVSVALRLQPGETVSDSCISASVTSGDVPLAAGVVSASFVHPPGAEPRVRVRTSVRIDEPFVTVTVNILCDTRLSRQFTVFADPPSSAPLLEPTVTVLAEAPSPPPAAAPAAVLPAGAAVAPPPSTPRASSGQVQAARAERPRERPRPAVAVNRTRAAAVAAAAPAAPASPAPPEPPESLKMSGGAIVPSEGGARLRLDAPIVNTANDQVFARAMAQRAEALATAKIAVDVAEAANQSAAQKVASIEAALAAARRETAEVKASLVRLREEQETADLFASLAPWLAAACAVLLAIVGLLFVRMRRLDAERLQGWLDVPFPRSRQSEFDTVAPVTQQFPSEFSQTMAPITRSGPLDELPQPRSLSPLPPLAAAAAPVAPAAPARGPFPETQPSSTVELEQAHGAHDISIEELLDVEQQAEFFVVLGQDDAAIDLLTSHVMSSGGASPMPYLKLLEIYRRIGDQTSYERTRKRFNARFNGLAPDWSSDPTAGRTLDEYPEVMQRIQQAWPDPVDAMAELQTLMFRNDSNRLFELPAYRDVMLLFTLARDLNDASGADLPVVDVLLPLGSPSATERDSAGGLGTGSASGLSLPPLNLQLGEQSLGTGTSRR